MFEVRTGTRALRNVSIMTIVLLLFGCGGGKDSENLGIDSVSDDEKSRAFVSIEPFGKGKTLGMEGSTFSIDGQTFSRIPCAIEGDRCIFQGEQNVAFGGQGDYIVKRFANSVACERSAFGKAPTRVARRCFLAAAAALTGGAAVSDSTSVAVPHPVLGTPVTAPSVAASTTPTVPVALVATSPPVDVSSRLSPQQAARFLTQATFGPNLTEINRLAAMGYGAWLDEQFAALPMDSHWNYVQRRGPIGCNPCTSAFVNGVMESFWLQAVQGRDQLRQRLTFALSELFVVSTVNTPLETIPTAHAGYLDMLARNVFGNYRTLLEQVATHPAMGVYLSHMKNEKEDPLTGRLPDENFAREVMQLFSIGLWELNEDGSRKKDATGNDIPTYGQAEIMGMAKVFTGWSWGNGDWDDGFTGTNPNDRYERAYNLQMQVYAARHSTSEKRIVRGVIIPANTSGQQSLKTALDTLYNHPNVGPFIGSQLIKRLVTSNPSPGYVARVTQAFNNNGNGVRGDMKAVFRTVLLDPEARDAAKIKDPQWGKLREPLIRYANFMRAFGVTSTAGVYRLHNLEDTLTSIGQNPLRAPSVFNWYRPDYSPPGEVMARGMVAPEFQITHETTTTGYANFMIWGAERQNTWFRDNVMAKYGDTSEYLAGNYSAEMALARDPNALLDRLSLLLMSGQMSETTRTSILEALNSTPVEANAGQLRVAFAVYLILVSPEFIVQK